MRRKEKEIQSLSGIESVIKNASVCRLGLTDDKAPYIVPLNFGYRDMTLFFHSAPKGKKTDLIKKNPYACFEIDRINEPIESDEPCSWGMQFQSVIGYGTIKFIRDMEEKKQALSLIMAQYSDGDYDFPDTKVKATAVYRLRIERMTGKQSGL